MDQSNGKPVLGLSPSHQVLPQGDLCLTFGEERPNTAFDKGMRYQTLLRSPSELIASTPPLFRNRRLQSNA